MTFKHASIAGGARVGERVITVGGATTLKYFIADHLGSVSVITDGSGTVLERLSYDAWGKRRNANGTDDPANSVTSAVTRGFSDHEMIGSVGLVNMNARIYDPELGRFMSPDSVIPSLLISQALNRYSYVFNNPCSLTDPSGQFPWGIVALVSGIASLFTHNQIVHTIAAIAIGFEFGPGNWLAGASAPARAFLGGFIVGGVTGHNAQSALFSGLQAFAFVGVGALNRGIGGPLFAAGAPGAILSNGLVGGLISEAEGGKFGAGFLAAGFSEAASPYINTGNHGLDTVLHAVSGGVASVLGGGKFANGAITGAFQYLYDDAALSEDLEAQRAYALQIMGLAEDEIQQQMSNLEAGKSLDADFEKRFRAWFGREPTLENLQKVAGIIQDAIDKLPGAEILPEDPKMPCGEGSSACTIGGRIYITRHFYTMGNDKTRFLRQASTLGHEATHLAGMIDMQVWSPMTAESYECFMFGAQGCGYK